MLGALAVLVPSTTGLVFDSCLELQPTKARPIENVAINLDRNKMSTVTGESGGRSTICNISFSLLRGDQNSIGFYT